MKLNWGHGIIIVYVIFVGGILLLSFKSAQQKFDLVQEDYYGAELKYQEVIEASKRAKAIGGELQLVKKGNYLDVTLPPQLQNSNSKVTIQMYCIADEKGDLKIEFISPNGIFNIELLAAMKGNYTLKLTVENNGTDYYFEKKIML